MRLTELNPEWLRSGGEGVYVEARDGSMVAAPLQRGTGVEFDCPCGKKQYGEHETDKLFDYHRLGIPFDVALDGSLVRGGGWRRTGDTFETLTLSPSILRNPVRGGCGQHFYIQNGEIVPT